MLVIYSPLGASAHNLSFLQNYVLDQLTNAWRGQQSESYLFLELCMRNCTTLVVCYLFAVFLEKKPMCEKNIHVLVVHYD